MASILIHIDIHIIRFAIVFIHLHIHFSVIYILTKSLITAFTIANRNENSFHLRNCIYTYNFISENVSNCKCYYHLKGFYRGITTLYLRQILAFRPKGKDKISERISRMYFGIIF